MLLALLAIAWMLGIVTTDVCRLAGVQLWWLTGSGLFSVVVGWRIGRVRLAGLCLLFAALGGLRYQSVQVETTSRSVWQLVGRGDVIVEGSVEDDSQRSEEGQRLVVRTEAAQIGERSGRVEGLLLIKLPPYPIYQYGQRLLVQGELERPRAADRPNAFDYREYLARKRIFALMDEPVVQVLPGNRGNPLLVMLLTFRNYCYTLLVRALPEPQASVAAGMLLGLKAAIADEVYTTFSVTGTSHILVVSGWNLTIVAAAWIGIARRLRLGGSGTFWGAFGAIWVYALFVGMTATVVRAALMASLTTLALSTERRAEPWTLLLTASMGLTCLDPQTLWDLGFQLSALATASLFAFGEPVEQWLRRCPPLNWSTLAWLTEALGATLAAQVLALPIILYHFGNLSLVAPLANVVIVPLVPYAMLLGASALLINLIAQPLAGWLSLVGWLSYGLWMVTWLPFAYITEGVNLLARIPWAAVQLPPFPLWMLLAYYAIVGGWWLWRMQRTAGVRAALR